MKELIKSIKVLQEKFRRILIRHFNNIPLNIHHRNLEKLVTEIFKVKNGLSPELMNNVSRFIEKPYSQRATSHFRLRKISTTKYGIEVYGIFFQMNMKLSNRLQILRQK